MSSIIHVRKPSSGRPYATEEVEHRRAAGVCTESALKQACEGEPRPFIGLFPTSPTEC